MIVNEKAFTVKLKNHLLINPRKNALKAVQRAANLVKNEAIRSISSGGKGDQEVRYDPRRVHTVSRAGDPPATDTGFLISQISATSEMRRDTAVGTVTSSAPYSIHLEFGTTKMPARPFLQPALDTSSTAIAAIFKKSGLISG
jgi:HK97 gp10 family phage protein